MAILIKEEVVTAPGPFEGKLDPISLLLLTGLDYLTAAKQLSIKKSI